MKDLQGFYFWKDCLVACPVIRDNTAYIEICIVTRIEDDKIYLDGGSQPIQYPERLLIVGE